MRYITTGDRIEYELGRQEGEQALILRLLQRRVGESLGEALLDFTSIEDLFNWLQANPAQYTPLGHGSAHWCQLKFKRLFHRPFTPPLNPLPVYGEGTFWL